MLSVVSGIHWGLRTYLLWIRWWLGAEGGQLQSSGSITHTLLKSLTTEEQNIFARGRLLDIFTTWKTIWCLKNRSKREYLEGWHLDQTNYSGNTRTLFKKQVKYMIGAKRSQAKIVKEVWRGTDSSLRTRIMSLAHYFIPRMQPCIWHQVSVRSIRNIFKSNLPTAKRCRNTRITVPATRHMWWRQNKAHLAALSLQSSQGRVERKQMTI